MNRRGCNNRGGRVMLEFHATKGAKFRGGVSRRDFLKAGSLGAGAVGLTLADLETAGAAGKSKDVNCILLFLVGGPSHLDTWDLKPAAPSNIRGPFRPIKTNVPAVEICEHFPRMAKAADRYAILRSVHHTAAPIHETGCQMMQTGCLFRNGREHPHYGSVVSQVRGSRRRRAALRRPALSHRQHRRQRQPRSGGGLSGEQACTLRAARRPGPDEVAQGAGGGGR